MIRRGFRHLHLKLCYHSVSRITMDVSQPLPPKVHFFRRELPNTCISFYSPEGKTIFSEALAAGHMECYFRLASQFRTQEEPAFCGLSTMVMVLNSLEIDPGRIWKGPWRWYHENMLDCCLPLQVVEQQGINFFQFVCLAQCNSLKVQASQMDDVPPVTLEAFRDVVHKYTKQDQYFLVASYSRKTLKQTGDGHFSPLAGYHPGRDLVLMLDTARFKYPPHWVSLPLLYESMCQKDAVTGRPRGFMHMSRQYESNALLLFRVTPNLSITVPSAPPKSILQFVQVWSEWLCQPLVSDMESSGIISDAVRRLVVAVSPENNMMLSTQLEIMCSDELLQEHNCSVHQIFIALERCDIFQNVSKTVDVLDNEGKVKLKKLFDFSKPTTTNEGGCNLFEKLSVKHFVTMLLLCWPYHCVQKEATLESAMSNLRDQAIKRHQLLMNEVLLLKKQLAVVLGYYHDQSCSSKFCCKKKRIC